MDRIPFGISRLDRMIGGGAPPGSVVLLAGETGAGAREFAHTSAAMNGLVRTDPDKFDLYYGDLGGDAAPPDGIHYLSFTSGKGELVREMGYTMEEQLVESGTEPVEFVDLSPEYFRLSQVPTEWYAGKTPDIASLGDRREHRDVLATLGEYLTENAEGSLVCIDSVTDLVSAASERMDWSDITLLMKGLKKASYQWGGLILLLVNVESMTDRQLGRLMDATDGTIHFAWESGGNERARTMVIKGFRGVLSRLEEEEIVQFETEIGEAGFDISDVRKIR